jgi:6-phosphofructokinase 1
MKEVKRIGVMTSGGDAPGMNAAVRSIVKYADSKGVETYGILHGFNGLIDGTLKPLTTVDVGGILYSGGTIIRTARSEEFKVEEGQKKALKTIEEYQLDGVIIIGGNGSLTGCNVLADYGVLSVGVPGTIDNDLYGTDMCIGVDTAINTVVDAVGKIKDTASSHERAFIVETMGRDSGYIALMSGLASGAEAILVPEVEINYDELADKLLKRRMAGKVNSVILVAEGAASAYSVSRQLKYRTGYEIRISILGHIQRGGTPTAFDRILAARLGAYSVDVLLQGHSGTMVGVQGNDLVYLPLDDILAKKKSIDLDIYKLAGIIG